MLIQTRIPVNVCTSFMFYWTTSKLKGYLDYPVRIILYLKVRVYCCRKDSKFHLTGLLVSLFNHLRLFYRTKESSDWDTVFCRSWLLRWLSESKTVKLLTGIIFPGLVYFSLSQVIYLCGHVLVQFVDLVLFVLGSTTLCSKVGYFSLYSFSINILMTIPLIFR